MLKDKLTALLFLVVITGLLIGMFMYKDNKPIYDFINEYRNTVVEGTPVIKRIKGAISAAETIMIRDTYRREDFNEIFGYTQKIMGKKILQDPAYGEIYKTEQNQITYSVKEKKIDFAIENIIELKKELDKIGIPLLYVQAPFKVSNEESYLPANIKDFADINANKFLLQLDENNIEYLDLRPLLRNGIKTQKELFYDTDHHWRVETAFDATWHIGRFLNKRYNFSIKEKYMNLDSYNIKKYADFFQGSMGRRVGVAYGGIDDFTLITPKFYTDFQAIQRDETFEKVYKGSFEEALLNKDNIDTSKPVDTNRYAVYRGDNAELIYNNKTDENGSILLIKDSFALPVYSFLAPAVKKISILDMRYFNKSVLEYARAEKPDIVIILYNGDCFNEEMFNFHIN